MWAKRFPVPEFDRYPLKNLSWQPPTIQDSLSAKELGCVAMNASAEYYDRFQFQGESLVAVACRLPDQELTISGNSFAWPIQRAVITDSLDASSCKILADWKTPRPMNTRLGPDGGIKERVREAYILLGHQFADHWIGNRIMLDNEWSGSLGNGFRILSSSETQIDDFHDAVIYVEWA